MGKRVNGWEVLFKDERLPAALQKMTADGLVTFEEEYIIKGVRNNTGLPRMPAGEGGIFERA